MELAMEGAPAKKRRLYELESSDIQFPSTSTSGQVEKKEGSSNTLHGVAYQIKLLMLFFHRGAEQGYSYKLETELTNSGKLDDVVFKYDKQNDKIENGVRYLQAKHSNIKTKTIQFNDLLIENDKVFGLLKYYLSFLTIVKNWKSEGKSTEFIKQITLCTNIKFHDNLVKCMEDMENTKEEDNILYGNVVLNRYKFKTKVGDREKSKIVGEQVDDKVEDKVDEIFEQTKQKKPNRQVETEFSGKDAIVTILSTNTDMHKLANQLAKDLSNKDKITFTSLYPTYHGWLVNHIFELPSEFIEEANDPKYYVKFRNTFIKIEEGKEKEVLRAFRETLLKAMAIDNQTFVNRWRVKKIQIIQEFFSEAKNYDTPQDFNKLAKALADSLSKNKKLTWYTLDKSNHGWLLENVFDIPEPYVKIRHDFLDNKSNNEDVVTFRKILDVNLKKNKKGTKTLTAFRDKIFVDKNFFGNPESNRTPDNSGSNDLIETFLTKLVFVVTCDEEILGKAVEQEIGNELNLIESESFASDLEKEMMNFIKDKTKYFVTQNTWGAFYDKNIHNIHRYAAMGITKRRRTKTEEYKCEFKKQEDQMSGKQEEDKKKRTLDKIMTADKRLMIIYQKYHLLTEIKIHQAFRCREDDAYIVDELKHSINEPNRGTIVKGFSSEKRSHLIIINDDIKICDKRIQFLKDVIEILKKNTKKRFTLLTLEKDEEICNIFQNVVENYEEFDDDDTFLELTKDTQNILEKRKVIFQGRETDLGMLITNDKLKRYVKGDILFKLITDSTKIIIGEAPAHQSNLDTFEDIKNFYIPRSLFLLIKIKDNIQCDEEYFCITDNHPVQANVDDRDIVLITQNEDANDFEKLCEMYDTKNIHWLINRIRFGLVWQETRGDLSKLHKYVDRHCTIYDTEDDTYQMDDVMSSSKKMILVAADAGMGKSTLLTHLTNTINETNKVAWVIRINLIDYQTQFYSLSEDNIDKRNAIKFLYKVLKFEVHDKTGKEINVFDFATLEDNMICLDIVNSLAINELKKFEIAIFNELFNDNNVVLILDGFDEIDQTGPISWVAQIKNMAKMKKIWMTTRPYNIQSYLERKLGVFSYQLNPITEKSKEFVKMFWKRRLTQDQSERLENNIKTDKKLDVYIEELFKILFSKQSDFTGVPLHVRMIAEIYEKGFEEFYYSEDEYLTDQLKQKIKNRSLLSLYEEFVNTKFYILHKDIDRNLFKNQRMLRTELKEVIKYHQKLSLIEILNEDAKNLISEQDIDEIGKTFKENMIGLVSGVDDKRRLVHRTFAEYFTAGYLVDRLKCDETVQNIDTNKVLSCIKDKINFDVIKFVNYYLIEEIDDDSRVLLNGVLSGDLKVLENKDLERVHDSYGRTPLHLACMSPNLNNFKYVFDINPAALNCKDTLFGWTPLHYVIAFGNRYINLCNSDIYILVEAMKRPDVEYDVNQKDKFDETLLMLSCKNGVLEYFQRLFNSFNEIDFDYENKLHMTVLDYNYNCNNNYEFGSFTEEYLLQQADLCKGTIGKRLLNILDDKDSEQQRKMNNILYFRGKEYTKEWIEVCIESDNNFIVKLLSENLIVANLVLDIESRHIDVNFEDTVENYTALKRAIKKEIKLFGFSSDKQPPRKRVILLLKAGAFYNDIEQNDWKNLWSKPDYFSQKIKDLINSIKNNDANSTESILGHLDYNYIDKDVLVNIRNSKDFMTPLQFAASLGYKDIVICLLKHGAFYNVLDEKRDVKTAEELTQNQDISDILAKTRNLFSAVKQGNIEKVFKYLDGNVNHKDKKGKQPIHLAIKIGNIEIIELLLNTDGIEPARATTLYQTNVLHLAVEGRDNEILETLLDHIDPEDMNQILNKRDIYGNTPLDIAKAQDDDYAIEIIRRFSDEVSESELESALELHLQELRDFRTLN